MLKFVSISVMIAFMLIFLPSAGAMESAGSANRSEMSALIINDDYAVLCGTLQAQIPQLHNVLELNRNMAGHKEDTVDTTGVPGVLCSLWLPSPAGSDKKTALNDQEAQSCGLGLPEVTDPCQ